MIIIDTILSKLEELVIDLQELAESLPVLVHGSDDAVRLTAIQNQINTIDNILSKK